MKKRTSRKQKIYKMRGCSKTRKNYLGGSANASLAYTGKPIFSVPNPHLAYTGKGGSSCGLSNPTTVPVNINATNSAYANTGPNVGVNTIFNNASSQLGGCGCAAPLVGGGRRRRKGGSCSSCAPGFMFGGTQHRSGCRCSQCKKQVLMKGGNKGIPYPDGLVGSPWTPSVGGWPGVNGIPGDSNYYPVNTYNNDISRQMVNVGANPPFLKGGKTDFKRDLEIESQKAEKEAEKTKYFEQNEPNVVPQEEINEIFHGYGGNKAIKLKKRMGKKQRGGTVSNFIGQDLINLGRQFQFGVGSAYNALAGYAAPVNPMPWKDQFPTRTSFNPATI